MTAGQSQKSPSLIWPLQSILEPIPLAEIFPRAQPLEVELGSGDGSFLVEHATHHRDRNYIGVERLLGRIRKLDKKARRAGLTNLVGIRIESSYFLSYLLPRQSTAALHIYFPDPWPKRKHWRHRLINEGFPALAAPTLQPGGMVYLRTDDSPYFKIMQEVFARSTCFEAVDTTPELVTRLTDFEREFQARGIQTLRAAYRKKSGGQ
jgi:tRNA (guanine-N7-)-methyltransferase